jgi:hypothetical protein
MPGTRHWGAAPAEGGNRCIKAIESLPAIGLARSEVPSLLMAGNGAQPQRYTKKANSPGSTGPLCHLSELHAGAVAKA